jgi:hypothetical protein
VRREDLPQRLLDDPRIRAQLGDAPSANKYHAKKATRGDITLDSGREAKRYDTIALLHKLGEIQWYARQCRFDIEGGEYRADFIIKWKDGRVTIEDAKGVRTPVYRRSKRQMRDRYNIEIEEV